MKRLFAIFAGLFCLLGPAVSLAQPAPLIIDQSRADRSPPTAPPKATPPTGSGRVEAAPATVAPFILKGVRVQGSSLSQAVLAAAWGPYLGHTVTADDLARIADAVGGVYSGSDIALYTILLPRQTFVDGLVRLDAVEGYISDVSVTSEPNRPPPRLLRAYAARLTAERPLRRATLERQIALMRDIPGVSIDVQLLQGGKTGAVRLVVKATHRRFEATSSINNRGSSVLGRTQVEVSASADGLLREGDKTTLTFAAPTSLRQFQFYGLAHSEPLGANGAVLNLTAGYLRTRPQIANVDLQGTAVTAGAQISYPLIRASAQSLYLSAGVDGVNSDNAIFGEQLSSERTRAVRLSAAYSRSSATRAIAASATISQGLDALGARMSDPTSGDASFSKLNLQATLAQQYGHWTVRLAGGAQVAASALPATEVFALGGAQFGRAFASAVATGQTGYAASAELAWRPAGMPTRFVGTELYGFVDGGHVSNPFGAIAMRNAAVSSAGGGLRVPVGGKVVAEFEVAKPLDGPAGVSRATRLMINLRSQF